MRQSTTDVLVEIKQFLKEIFQELNVCKVIREEEVQIEEYLFPPIKATLGIEKNLINPLPLRARLYVILHMIFIYYFFLNF